MLRGALNCTLGMGAGQGGTGLGLHIVYSIVTNRLGGRLDLDSAPGSGTRIQIILPRVAPLEQAAE